MSANVTELFTGGIVTVKHPALLRAGELQRADDCVYRDKDEAILRAPGRTQLTNAVGSTLRGIGHLAFDGVINDQFLALGRETAGSPTWYNVSDGFVAPQFLYGADFTTTSAPAPIGSGSAFTLAELGGSGLWVGTFTSTSLNCQIVVASCTIAVDGISVSTSNSVANVLLGAVVSGTGVVAGTRVLTLPDTSAKTFTLDTVCTAGTVTLTFTQYPFLSTAVGAKLIGDSLPQGMQITAVSNQDGTTGHYRTATISDAASSDGVHPFVITFGASYPLPNTGTEILDYIQYGARKYYLWDGIGRLNVAEAKTRVGTTSILGLRPSGLRSIENATGFGVATCAGSWDATSTRGAGKYWFLITEIFSPDADLTQVLKDPILRNQVVESAYLAADPSTTTGNTRVGLPIGVNITDAATQGVRVTFPAVTNNGTDGYIATHWGIYVSEKSDTAPTLSSMRRCATVKISQYTSGFTYDLIQSVKTQIKGATAIGATTLRPSQPAFSGGGQLLLGLFDDKHCGSIASNDHGTQLPILAANRLKTFGFSASGAYAGLTPVGVQVQVRGQANSNYNGNSRAHFWFRLIIAGDALTTEVFHGDFANHGHETKFYGGPTDLLGVPWSLTNTQNFEVEIGQDAAASVGGVEELDLDGVQILVYYTGQEVDFSGPAYRTVTYRDQVGDTVTEPARLRAPIAFTGDFFNGSLVLNNVSIANQIRFSLPGDPEAFPKPYELSFNTGKKDKVTFIKTLGPILFVGMENSLKRVNYLPTETNTDLNSGLAHEDIASDHGIPGPFCAVKFDMPGEGTLVAYASQVGPFISNGIWTRPLNLDLDWSSLVKVSALSTAIMRVYAKEKWIAFYYCPAGATHNRNTRVLYFCYQADKIKQGAQGIELPAVGPSVVSARAAHEVWIGSTPFLLSANETDGKVYVEDSGLTVPSGYQVTLTATASTLGDGKAASGTDVSINPLVRTRKIYPAGIEQDAHGENLYVLYSAFGSRSTTATADAVAGSAAVSSSSAVFGSVSPGMLISGTGIDGGTIVLSVAGDNKSIVISRVANTDAATGTVFTFDTGTLAITIRGSGVNEAVLGLQTVYGSTTVGDMLSLRAPEIRQGFELQFEKVPLTFDSNHDTATSADLHVNLRIHQWTYMLLSAGREMNRAA